MKYFTTILLLIIAAQLAHSQTYEVGAMIVGANHVGDVGKTTYIAPNTVGFGGIVKWNRSPRHAFRASILVADLRGDDSESNETRRQQRGYSFDNTITEFSAGLEYTFWEYNVHNGRNVSTPYLYTGLTYFLYKASYINSATKEFRDYDQAGSVAIPIVLGYKAKMSPSFAVAVEIGARYTFTDDLDGSNPVGIVADNESLRFGNVNNNDWYIFTGVNFSFTFGRKPCYCNF
ncbi:type IX secretion system protein PorG [Ulvibacter litoralis]|uniref:DUF6089 domain-containing protein n=1 Tax=Ulvibacter litoralis TaxID=227084 RepID=A0A1G7J7S6_9FLAO|nr:DUF6089 family protein [Ulvibacter litoralis]GHC64268.1 hypothetical protein GCM10008083_31950 [Ulvibacter litoralis]SDF20970.1 hypothetical protein SAMN05421855_10924 [Ulvibacter litoralis]